MKNKLLFLVIIYCAIVSPLFAQTTTIHTLDEATVQIAPVPAEQNGIHPATDYNTVTKPLLYEPFTTNPPFLNSAADIYPPAGSDRTNVFFGGDVPGQHGFGAVAASITTKETYSTNDFPILLETNFYNRSSNFLYNESYFWLGDANYELFGANDYANTNTTGKDQEGILIGSIPKRVGVFDRKTKEEDIENLFLQEHTANEFGQWYNFKVCLNYINSEIVVEHIIINEEKINTIPVSIGTPTWVNNLRLGIRIDDLAASFKITTSANNCQEESLCTLSQNNLSIAQLDPTGCTSNDGTIQISLDSSYKNQSFQVSFLKNQEIENKEMIFSDENGNLIINALTAGFYNSFLLTYNGSCELLLDNGITLTSPQSPPIPITSSQSISCLGEPLTLSASSSAERLQWTGPNDFSAEGNLIEISQNATEEFEGIYTVVAIDGDCKSLSDTLNIQFSIPAFNLGADTSICQGTFINLGVPDSFNSYSWSNGNSTNTIDVIESGIYKLSVINDENCKGTDSIRVSVLPIPNINLPSFVELDYGDSIRIAPIILPNNNWTYQWSPIEGLSCSNCLNPTIKILNNQTYSLSVSNNEELCPATVFLDVTVQPRPELYIPNIFSPNQDGINDIFTLSAPSSLVKMVLSFNVFDRWGNLVYNIQNISSSNIHTLGWDGTFKGKPLNQGVFSYLLEIEFIDGEINVSKGDITLIR